MGNNFVRITGIIFSAAVLWLTPPGAMADDIIIAADRWCPINCEPGSDAPGIMVEIARQVFSQAGHRVEYRVVPWARAIEEARQGKINGIIGAFTGDAPNFIFPDHELLMVSGSAFFVPQNSSWTYEDLSSLSDVVLGAIRRYDYGETLNAYIDRHENTRQVQLISGENPLERNIQKLLLGRIDVVVEAAPVFWYTASRMGVREQLRFAGQSSGPEKCFIAFSPVIAESREYARILSEGVDALRRSGRLQEILEKYGFEY